MTRIENPGNVGQAAQLARQTLLPEVRAEELARTAVRLLAPGAQRGDGEVRALAREVAALPPNLQDRVLGSVPGLDLDAARAALAGSLARGQSPLPSRVAPQDLMERAPLGRFEGPVQFESARDGGLAPAQADGERVAPGVVVARDDGAAVGDGPAAPPRSVQAAPLDERQLLADALQPRRPVTSPAASLVQAAPSPVAVRPTTVEDVLRPALRDLAQEASRLATLAERLRGAATMAPLPSGFGARYQAFVADRALSQIHSAAGKLSGLVAVGSRLEGASGPGPALADAARAVASLQARAADATTGPAEGGRPRERARQAALREVSGLERALEAVTAALAVAGGRTVLVGRLQAEPTPGASAPPSDHLAAGLSLEDLARVGVDLGTRFGAARDRVDGAGRRRRGRGGPSPRRPRPRRCGQPPPRGLGARCRCRRPPPASRAGRSPTSPFSRCSATAVSRSSGSTRRRCASPRSSCRKPAPCPSSSRSSPACSTPSRSWHAWGCPPCRASCSSARSARRRPPARARPWRRCRGG